MTRNDYDENYCFFIDRKICKGYTFPRIIYTKYRFTDDVFNDTLLHGELIKDYDDNWKFIFNDIISYCGKSCYKYNKLKKIKLIYELLETKYNQDSIMDVCNLRVKSFFNYTEINTLINDFIPNLKYKVNGIMFNSIYPNKSDILLLNNFKNKFEGKNKVKKSISKNQDLQEIVLKKNSNNSNSSNNSFDSNSKNRNSKNRNSNKFKISKNDVTDTIESESEENISISIESMMNKNSKNSNTNNILDREFFNFIVERTEQGIFKLTSLVNKNKKVFGYARIDSLETQELLLELIENTPPDMQLIIKCKYCKKFKKFIPVDKSDEDEPDQYIDVKQYVQKISK